MKVNGPGQTSGVSGSKKKGSTSEADGTFDDFLAAGASGAAPAKATHSIAMVDGLLAVQAAEDPTARAGKKRMRARAGTILTELDKIRIAMLNGKLTVGHMIDIADVVASHREKISDPGMTALMDEIDLRAQVELAKMRVVLDKKAGSGT